MNVANIAYMNFMNPVNANARANPHTNRTATQGTLSDTSGANALQTSGALHFLSFDGDSAEISPRALELSFGNLNEPSGNPHNLPIRPFNVDGNITDLGSVDFTPPMPFSNVPPSSGLPTTVDNLIFDESLTDSEIIPEMPGSDLLEPYTPLVGTDGYEEESYGQVGEARSDSESGQEYVQLAPSATDTPGREQVGATNNTSTPERTQTNNTPTTEATAE